MHHSPILSIQDVYNANIHVGMAVQQCEVTTKCGWQEIDTFSTNSQQCMTSHPILQLTHLPGIRAKWTRSHTSHGVTSAWLLERHEQFPPTTFSFCVYKFDGLMQRFLDVQQRRYHIFLHSFTCVSIRAWQGACNFDTTIDFALFPTSAMTDSLRWRREGERTWGSLYSCNCSRLVILAAGHEL